MFTGLIETVGTVEAVHRPAGSCATYTVDSALRDLTLGESVSVDGACMSVVACDGARFRFEAMPESLARTTLGALEPGGRVNLERALRVGDRLGGHWVSGHVDGVVEVAAVRAEGEDHRVELVVPAELRRYVAHKGSVTLAGVSLTVSRLRDDGFEVALIPLTLERTTLGALRPGARLNLEVDLLARYLERLLPPSSTGST